MQKHAKFYVSLSLVCVALLVAVWMFYPSGINPADAALAEYQIEKMTCASCVGNIKKALSDLDGIASVEVNLTSNRGRVTYDPNEIDSRVIAEAITGAGYPASLRLELAPQEYAALQQEQSQLGQQYLARIGDRLLARSDFEQLVQLRTKGDPAPGQNEQVWQAVWKEVLQRELLLSAADQSHIIVQDGEVDARLDELKKENRELDQIVTERYGSMDSFRKRLREDMIINRNINDHVYEGSSLPADRQAKFQGWYAELQKNTEVIIFDPRLKSMGQGGSGCACCNS
ncbi:MAG: cation transporter [Desulfuromonadales bacterium]